MICTGWSYKYRTSMGHVNLIEIRRECSEPCTQLASRSRACHCCLRSVRWVRGAYCDGEHAIIVTTQSLEIRTHDQMRPPFYCRFSQDMNTTVRDMPTVLHHKAELHWNIFGEQPRMFRGTVTRDRLPRSLLPPWLFRPVVGSFVGSGIGNDTADKSYRHRQAPASGEDNATPPRASPQTDRY